MSPFGQFFASGGEDESGKAWQNSARSRAMSGNAANLEAGFAKMTPRGIRASTTVVSPATKRQTDTNVIDTDKLTSNHDMDNHSNFAEGVKRVIPT